MYNVTKHCFFQNEKWKNTANVWSYNDIPLQKKKCSCFRGYLNFRCLSMKLDLKVGNLFLTMDYDYGMSSSIATNKLPTLKSNSYLHTQISGVYQTIEK